MAQRAGKVISHRTYVAALCLDCNNPALRVCILHDECEFGTTITPCKGHH